MCAEENRDKGEIKKTKGEENVWLRIKRKKKKKKGVRLVVRVVWGKSMNNFYFFIFLSKLMKKKIILE